MNSRSSQGTGSLSPKVALPSRPPRASSACFKARHYPKPISISLRSRSQDGGLGPGYWSRFLSGNIREGQITNGPPPGLSQSRPHELAYIIHGMLHLTTNPSPVSISVSYFPILGVPLFLTFGLTPSLSCSEYGEGAQGQDLVASRGRHLHPGRTPSPAQPDTRTRLRLQETGA